MTVNEEKGWSESPDEATIARQRAHYLNIRVERLLVKVQKESVRRYERLQEIEFRIQLLQQKIEEAKIKYKVT